MVQFPVDCRDPTIENGWMTEKKHKNDQKWPFLRRSSSHFLQQLTTTQSNKCNWSVNEKYNYLAL